jgi:hypothetical protein
VVTYHSIKSYRGTVRTYLTEDETAQVDAHTGPRGGRYMTRNRLRCMDCHHLTIAHGATGCDTCSCGAVR